MCACPYLLGTKCSSPRYFTLACDACFDASPRACDSTLMIALYSSLLVGRVCRFQEKRSFIPYTNSNPNFRDIMIQ